MSLVTWLDKNGFSACDVDCATTVMLKILDGKCKMSSLEKAVMTELYDAVKTRPCEIFKNEGFHELIAIARNNADDELRQAIYEKRVLAETQLSRTIMKAFKKRIRDNGIFEITTKGHL